MAHRTTTNVPGRGNDRGPGTAALRLAASTTGRTRQPERLSQPWPPAGHPATRAESREAASAAPEAVQGSQGRCPTCGHLEAVSLLLPHEVAALFRVDVKTVTKWARAGKLPSIRTLGGHRRYPEAEIRALLAAWNGGRNPLKPLGSTA